MALQRLLVSVCFAMQCCTGAAIGQNLVLLQFGATKVNTSTASLLASKCEDSCSSRWVRGMTTQLQDSSVAWETRCSWKGCAGCDRCIPAVKDPADVFRVAQAAKAADAAHAAQLAEKTAHEARQAADEAKANAVVKMKEYTNLKKAAQEEVGKLTTAFDLPQVDLPNIVDTTSKCEPWCSSAEYMDRSWEKKCNWKDCKDCSLCASISTNTTNTTHKTAFGRKEAVVDRVISAVTHFLQESQADTASLSTDLDIAMREQ